jgi:hypothetical protein
MKSISVSVAPSAVSSTPALILLAGDSSMGYFGRQGERFRRAPGSLTPLARVTHRPDSVSTNCPADVGRSTKAALAAPSHIIIVRKGLLGSPGPMHTWAIYPSVASVSIAVVYSSKEWFEFIRHICLIDFSQLYMPISMPALILGSITEYPKSPRGKYTFDLMG